MSGKSIAGIFRGERSFNRSISALYKRVPYVLKVKVKHEEKRIKCAIYDLSHKQPVTAEPGIAPVENYPLWSPKPQDYAPLSSLGTRT